MQAIGLKGGSGVVYSVGQSVAQDLRRRFKF
ncbi:hypothetical protein HNQ53_002822 [Microbulbifer hydrolyticus]|uniref:Uncharacterized protein n=1 Tax=Microbulbifer hydrolyticus TaxID=48074 RepID=A0AA89PXB0_9GAMM|nr:hypothetical protein [Microbulbifer hydrolyticus]